MEVLLLILLLFSSSTSSTNLTYVLTPINASYINAVLRSNSSLLSSTSFVTRLSSTSDNLLTSTRTLLAATDSRAIVFVSDTGDCSYPSALAQTYPSKYISSPICFSQVSSFPNLLQLTVTSGQLGQAAAALMNSYALHYFSIIISASNSFYVSLAEQFSNYLTQQTYLLERTISVPNFSATSIASLKTRGKLIYSSLDFKRLPLFIENEIMMMSLIF